MRLNKFLASATGMSRRAADQAITDGHVLVNGEQATLGQVLTQTDTVAYNGTTFAVQDHFGAHLTVMLNKPVRYVCSRNGQGSKTIYELLPALYHHLKPVGRLDKDSSGLLLLTNDGKLAHHLTHPRFEKQKVYEVTLDQALRPEDLQQLTAGIIIENYTSTLELKALSSAHKEWQVTLRQGRNRQIRRSFGALGYDVIKLHRITFGSYVLDTLPLGAHTEVNVHD